MSLPLHWICCLEMLSNLVISDSVRGVKTWVGNTQALDLSPGHTTNPGHELPLNIWLIVFSTFGYILLLALERTLNDTGLSE